MEEVFNLKELKELSESYFLTGFPLPPDLLFLLIVFLGWLYIFKVGGFEKGVHSGIGLFMFAGALSLAVFKFSAFITGLMFLIAVFLATAYILILRKEEY
jgi:uncharacterized integral membrane protein